MSNSNKSIDKPDQDHPSEKPQPLKRLSVQLHTDIKNIEKQVENFLVQMNSKMPTKSNSKTQIKPGNNVGKPQQSKVMPENKLKESQDTSVKQLRQRQRVQRKPQELQKPQLGLPDPYRGEKSFERLEVKQRKTVEPQKLYHKIQQPQRPSKEYKEPVFSKIQANFENKQKQEMSFSQYENPQKYPEQQFIVPQKSKPIQKHVPQLSKFNYYGRYRFEEKEQQQKVQQPLNREPPKVQIVRQEHRKSQISPKTTLSVGHQATRERFPVEDSVFLKGGNPHFPKYEYYLEFEKKEKLQNPPQRDQSQFYQTSSNQRWASKPNLPISKTVRKQQTQFRNTRQAPQTQNNFYRKTDQSIKLNNKVQRMMQNLWP